jgi:hypothetical protein
VSTPVVKKNEYIKQSETSLPPLNEVVVESEVKLTQKKLDINDDSSFDIKKIFFAIASNNTSELKQKSEKVFNELKLNSSYKLFNLLKPSIKLITASQNGALILFEDEVDAKLFNNFVKTYDGLVEINKAFGKLMYVVGYTRDELGAFTQEYITFQKSGEKFNEPDITVLDKIIKSKNSITKLAFDIFS